MYKIVFFLPDIEGGGAERVTLNIIEMLDREIFDIYLVLGNQNGDLGDSLPSQITIIDLNVRRTLLAFFPLYKVCREIQPSMIFSSLNRANIFAILIGRLMTGVKVIIREPGMPSRQIGHLSKNLMILTKILYPFADRIIAQTQEMKQEICLCYAIKCDKIDVVPNPLNIKLIDSLVEQTHNHLNVKNVNIVGIGSLVPVKGFDILIKSFQKVLLIFPNAHLYILGKGSYETALKQLAISLGISDKVSFMGFQKNPYIYLKYADLFVLSSRKEGLPNVVLESLYLQTNVVVTDCVPYITNLVIDNNLGEVACIEDEKDLSEKIIKALNSNNYNYMLEIKNLDLNFYFRDVLDAH